MDDARPRPADRTLGAVPSRIGQLPGPLAAADMRAPPASWNTENLGLRVGGDVLAAGAAGGLVAPVIAAIDRSIIENAAGRRSISASLAHSAAELLTAPHRVLLARPFGLVFLLYAATYMAANTVDTVCSTLAPADAPAAARAPGATTAGTPKFLATSAANLSLCVYKDSQFARLFGAAAAAPRALPPASLLLFGARDALTVFASFNLPPLIAPALPPGAWEAYASRASAAQFLAPAAVQALSTPLHLLGLDLYNRGGPGVAVSAGQRAAKVCADWAKSCAARVARILPAFGVGGVVNAKVRRAWMDGLPSAAA